MSEENLLPTPGASGVTVVSTKFYGGDKLRYCVMEFWNCGAHDEEECCTDCKKRVVAFRYRRKDAEAVINQMLAAVL